jgi:hypothetical protein
MAGESKGLVVSSQHQGDAFTITTYIPPRRNGGPNCGAYGAVMVALAKIVPDAFDPEPSAQPAASAPMPVPIPAPLAAEMLRDGVVPPDDDEGQPYPIPGCATGVCRGD